MYFHCQLANTSNLIYDIDFINMSIIDSKQLKSKTQQDITQPITFVNKKSTRIQPHSSMNIVFQTPKYTMENGKICNIECYEHKGGRHLKIQLKNNVLLEATDLKTIQKK